jgi:3-oxoacyl-[acyl-carrier protein] reductase
MDLSIKNKIALIGGASKGLGKGCALQLAKEGVNLALCSNDEPSLEETAELIRSTTHVEVLPIFGDLSNVNLIKKDVVDKILTKYGKIDILVVNSGGPKPGTFFDLTENDWTNGYNSVLNYVIELYRLIIPQMKERNWGRIINCTSLSVKEPAESLLLSNVFRTGVVSMAKSMSKDLIKHGITINNVCPGAFKTDRAIELMRANSLKSGVSIEEIEKASIKNMPLGRYQEPEELGALVAFLASEHARGITGTTLQIDGGISNSLL